MIDEREALDQVEILEEQGMSDEDVLLLLLLLSAQPYYVETLANISVLEEVNRAISNQGFDEWKSATLSDIQQNGTDSYIIKSLRDKYGNSIATSAIKAHNLGAFKAAKDRGELLEYIAIEDDRVREHHLALKGLVGTAQVFEDMGLIPPLEYNCRCWLQVISRLRAIARTGSPTGSSDSEFQSKAANFDENAKVERGFTSPIFDLRDGMYYYLLERAELIANSSYSRGAIDSKIDEISTRYVRRFNGQ